MPLLPFEAPPEPADAPVLHLDGAWTAQAKPDAAWLAGSGDQGLAVTMPGELHLQGVAGCQDAPIGVRRRIRIPADWAGRQPWLISEGFSSRAAFSVDGAEIAAAARIFLPLGAAVPVAAGATATLAAVLTRDPLADRLASLSKYAAYPVVGLHRPLRLVGLPATHLARLWLDGGWAEGVATLRVAAVLRGAERGELRIHVGGAPHVVPLADATDTTLTLGALTPWHAEAPTRHDVTVELHVAGAVVATYTRRIGFRTVAIRDGVLTVNGAPVWLRGVNRHVSHPLEGRTVDPARERADIALMRAHHVSWIRTSHYPASRALLDACDDLGMFVESEAPHCWSFHWGQPAWSELDAVAQAAATAQISEQCALTAAETIGHASVVAVSLANESKWSPAFAAAAARVRDTIAPSAPLTFEWAVYADDDAADCPLAADHYPDMFIDHAGQMPAATADFAPLYRKERLPKLTRPILIGETAHLSCYNRAELAADPGIRGDWGTSFAACVARFRAMPGCAGLAVWSGVDDRFLIHGQDGEADRWVGYGDWGPFDAWRRPRPEATALARTYDPVQVVRSDADLTVTNHHDITPLDGWTIAIDDGTPLPLPLPPHATQRIAHGAARSAVVRRADGAIHAQHAWAPPAAPLPAFTASAPAADGWSAGDHRIAVAPDGRVRLCDADGAIAWGLMPVVRQHQDRRQRDQIDDDRPAAVTRPCRGWRVSDVARDGDALLIHGATADATVALRLAADAALTLDLSFTLTLTGTCDLWEAGVCLDLDAAHDRLTWTRHADGVWRDDEPQRPSGSARAWRGTGAIDPGGTPTSQPHRPWSQDEGDSGSNDFASLRRAVTSAALTDAAGHGLVIAAAGDLCIRAQMLGGTVRLHLLAHASGGSERFGFGRHWRLTNRAAGWTSTGRCRITLR